jgi:hypothetical protein
MQLIELGQQLYQRTLTGAVLSNDRNYRPSFQIQVHIFEHTARRSRIGEGHMLQADTVDEPLGGGCVSACSTRDAA